MERSNWSKKSLKLVNAMIFIISCKIFFRKQTPLFFNSAWNQIMKILIKWINITWINWSFQNNLRIYCWKRGLFFIIIVEIKNNIIALFYCYTPITNIKLSTIVRLPFHVNSVDYYLVIHVKIFIILVKSN